MISYDLKISEATHQKTFLLVPAVQQIAGGRAKLITLANWRFQISWKEISEEHYYSQDRSLKSIIDFIYLFSVYY